MKIFNPDYAVDLLQALLWQYDNAPRLQKLLSLKQEWYNQNHTQFWDDWFTNVYNINTANDFGLTVWGKLLRVDRTYIVDGEPYSLDTEQYRLLLKGRLLYLSMNGSVPEVNNYLHLLFGDRGPAYIIDNQDMTIRYVLEFIPTASERVVLLNTNVLPRPAGVGYTINAIPRKNVFGFRGSGLRPFNQGVFWDNSDLSRRENEKK